LLSKKPFCLILGTSICQFFLRGFCKWGESCRFQHIPEVLEQRKGKKNDVADQGPLLVECRYWRFRDCWAGDKCPFLHSERHEGELCYDESGQSDEKQYRVPRDDLLQNPQDTALDVCKDWREKNYCLIKAECDFAHPPDKYIITHGFSYLTNLPKILRDFLLLPQVFAFQIRRTKYRYQSSPKSP
jgi:hypothetical protein